MNLPGCTSWRTVPSVQVRRPVRQVSSSRSPRKLAKRIAEVQSKIVVLQSQVGGVIAAEDPMMAAQRYEQIDRELAAVDAGLRAARERKDVLESEALQTSKYRAILSDGQPVMRGEDRLIAAQQELVALQARYSDTHPDIVRLKREIAALTGGPA